MKPISIESPAYSTATDSSASPNESSRGSQEVRNDIYLRFTIDGDGFSSERFNTAFGTDVRARNVNYWMAYQDREQTVFRMETDTGEWELDINFKIDAEALGTYEFEPNDLNMNRTSTSPCDTRKLRKESSTTPSGRCWG